ncbi:hypothetical protein ACOMHN_042782 [Nucella lapillus]
MSMFVVLLAVLVPGVMLDPRPDGPSFEELTLLVEALEKDAADALRTLSELETLCAVNQLRRADLFDRTLPMLLANNPRQDGAIDDVASQVKTLTHRVDADIALATQTNTVAGATASASQDIAFNIDTQIVDHNKLQGERIVNLTADVVDVKDEFLQGLGITLTGLQDQLIAVVDDTTALGQAVDQVKCEYGYAKLTPGIQNMTFLTPFTSNPDVTFMLTSFKFRLGQKDYHAGSYPKPGYGYRDDEDDDDHDHHDEDTLVVDKFVETTSTEGFSVNVVDDSLGSVELLYACCSWSACQKM